MSDPITVIHRGGAELTRGRSALPTPSQSLLVRAATGPDDRIEATLRDWRALVDLSGPIDGGSFRLLPIVYHRMQSAGIDDPNRGMFKGVYRRSMVENSRVLDAAAPVLAALAEAGMTPWVVKGAAVVAAGYYPTMAARPMADVDMVVDFSRRAEALEVMRSLGYVAERTDRQQRIFHATGLTNAAGHEVDLHWHQISHVRHVDADELITRGSQRVTLGDAEVLVPGPTGLLIGTTIHGLRPNVEPPVRWLVDVALLLDRDGALIDWPQVLEFAERFRVGKLLLAGFEVLESATGRTVPDAVMQTLRARRWTPIERVDHRLPSAPWNTVRGRGVELIAGYAGGDRELRHIVTGMPRYLAARWDLGSVRSVPAASMQKLARHLRGGGRS